MNNQKLYFLLHHWQSSTGQTLRHQEQERHGNEDGDHYHSPYSAESMGAIDDDYTTHSSQNYLMMGLLVAYQATGKVAYLEEVDIILGFLDAHLLVDGQILHHWMNGRAATEDDPYLYCLGCNVQTLRNH